MPLEEWSPLQPHVFAICKFNVFPNEYVTYATVNTGVDVDVDALPSTEAVTAFFWCTNVFSLVRHEVGPPASWSPYRAVVVLPMYVEALLTILRLL